MTTKAIGDRGERRACDHLLDAGLSLRVANYRCRLGEIDLIMRDGPTLVFVEVRLRSNGRYGSGADSVDWRKRRRLIRVAEQYLQRCPHDGPCRFDVVSLDDHGGIDWIANAFDAS